MPWADPFRDNLPYRGIALKNEARMLITYWSDYACPYCYIGEARLKRAIKAMKLEGKVALAPRAFELNPDAPREVISDTATRFAAKYHMTLEEARAQIEHISRLGQAEGLDFRYGSTRYTNTFDAHRLMKLALSKNDPELADRTNELLFAAYFTKNLRLSEEAVLIEAGIMAGLKEEETVETLRSDRFGSEVRLDEQAASARGVRGVPFFIFPGGFAVPGAVSFTEFKDALASAMRADRVSSQAEVRQCDPDGCAASSGNQER